MIPTNNRHHNHRSSLMIPLKVRHDNPLYLEQPTGQLTACTTSSPADHSSRRENDHYTVAKGCRIPQAQAGVSPEHPQPHLRLLHVVSRVGSPPSPASTCVITGHPCWIVCALTAVLTVWWTSRRTLISSRTDYTSGVRHCKQHAVASCVSLLVPSLAAGVLRVKLV